MCQAVCRWRAGQCPSYAFQNYLYAQWLGSLCVTNSGSSGAHVSQVARNSDKNGFHIATSGARRGQHRIDLSLGEQRFTKLPLQHAGLSRGHSLAGILPYGVQASEEAWGVSQESAIYC